jgi:hypothetical protein
MLIRERGALLGQATMLAARSIGDGRLAAAAPESM